MTNEQIVALYEQSNVTIDELSQIFELPHEVIKIALASKSVKYRQDCRNGDETFDKNSVKLAKMVMVDCLHSEESTTKFRAAKYIIDESKGRNDLTNAKNLGGINLNLITMHWQQAKEAQAKAKAGKSKEQELIEV